MMSCGVTFNDGVCLNWLQIVIDTCKIGAKSEIRQGSLQAHSMWTKIEHGENENMYVLSIIKNNNEKKFKK